MTYKITFYDKDELFVKDEIAKEAMKSKISGAKCIMINGNLYDCAGISKIEKEKDERWGGGLVGNNLRIEAGRVSKEVLIRTKKEIGEKLNKK